MDLLRDKDIICQTVWKSDVVKALFATKGQGESASENETFLKQLLSEQYDTQLARQEMAAESLKRRLEQLLDELKRRKLAKDRVVEVMLFSGTPFAVFVNRWALAWGSRWNKVSAIGLAPLG